jgi:replicative DNA helicase
VNGTVIPFEQVRSSEPVERQLPANIEVEQALLGALLMNNDVLGKVSSFLLPDHFSEDLHRRTYEVAAAMITEGKVANAITLKTFLGDQDLGGITVSQYLARLSREATTIVNAEDYARTIHDLWVRRQIITVGTSMVDLAYDSPVSASPADQIEKAQDALATHQVALSDRERRSVNLQVAGAELMAEIEADLKGEARAIPSTGIRFFDNEIGGGLQPSTLITAPARTSMGKSIFGVDVGKNVASQDFGVVYHSLEMSRRQVLARLVSSHLFNRGVQLPFENILKRGGLTPHQADQVVIAIREIERLPFQIEDGGGRTIMDITNSTERLMNGFKKRGIQPGLVVIDHAHIVSPSRVFKDDVAALKEVTLGALNLCKRLDCAVLLLAQCNRNTESRGDDDRRPRLADVRGSGAFEEDSDVVVFPYRPAYYVERSAAFRRNGDDEASYAAMAEYDACKHVLELIIDKNRAGRAGQIVQAWIDPALNAIRNLHIEH